jgi:hypothetical protein
VTASLAVKLSGRIGWEGFREAAITPQYDHDAEQAQRE